MQPSPNAFAGVGIFVLPDGNHRYLLFRPLYCTVRSFFWRSHSGCAATSIT
jgi:hypothetical protein